MFQTNLIFLIFYNNSKHNTYLKTHNLHRYNVNSIIKTHNQKIYITCNKKLLRQVCKMIINIRAPALINKKYFLPHIIFLFILSYVNL